jgi:hypothetical protein
MDRQAFRSQVLFEHGASLPVAKELLAYNAPAFKPPEETKRLLAEPHLRTWEQYCAEAQGMGAFAALKKRLVQWQFPIERGISRTVVYRTAVQSGIFPDTDTGIQLQQPEQLCLCIEPTLAGPIPVIVAPNRHDFVVLVQAMTRQNEPESVPETMGGCIVARYNNWDRIRTLRLEWEASRDYPPAQHEWATEFRLYIKLFPALYQDSFIILSQGDYSGIAAEAMGVPEPVWRRYSHQIRLTHECTHYATFRLFGSMRNNVLDELIADYWGIRRALGRYRADWFLRFMGDDGAKWRDNGRIQTYRGDPSLSDEAFRILQGLLRQAAHNLERVDREMADELATAVAQQQLLTTLTQFTLEELSSAEAVRLIRQQYYK